MKKLALVAVFCLCAVIALMPSTAAAYNILDGFMNFEQYKEISFITDLPREKLKLIEVSQKTVDKSNYKIVSETDGKMRITFNEEYVRNLAVGEYSIKLECVDYSSVSPASQFYILPRIETQPENITVTEGADATFTIATADNTKVNYQWHCIKETSEDSEIVKKATKASYTISNVKKEHNNNRFFCELRYVGTNHSIPLCSAEVTLTVLHILEGAGQERKQGETLSFTTNIPSDKLLKAQVNGKDVDAQYYTRGTKDGNTLITLSGEYTKTLYPQEHTLTLKTTYGDVTADFTIKPSFEITRYFDDTITVNEGETATFKLEIEGEVEGYQWYVAKNPVVIDEAITGETGKSYTTPAVDRTYDGYSYFCAVTGLAGYIDYSGSVQLHVTGISYNVTEGAGQEWKQVDDASFTTDIPYGKTIAVQVDGNDVDSANYTLTKEGGFTQVTLNGTYTATLAVDEHRLTLKASDGTAEANFSITPAFVITRYFDDTITVKEGETATFTLEIEGTVEGYQWYVSKNPDVDPEAIPGATEISYTTPAVDRTYEGYSYFCVVTGLAGYDDYSGSVLLHVADIGYSVTEGAGQ